MAAIVEQTGQMAKFRLQGVRRPSEMQPGSPRAGMGMGMGGLGGLMGMGTSGGFGGGSSTPLEIVGAGTAGASTASAASMAGTPPSVASAGTMQVGGDSTGGMAGATVAGAGSGVGGTRPDLLALHGHFYAEAANRTMQAGMQRRMPLPQGVGGGAGLGGGGGGVVGTSAP